MIIIDVEGGLVVGVIDTDIKRRGTKNHKYVVRHYDPSPSDDPDSIYTDREKKRYHWDGIEHEMEVLE